MPLVHDDNGLWRFGQAVTARYVDEAADGPGEVFTWPRWAIAELEKRIRRGKPLLEAIREVRRMIGEEQSA
ncbi:MAG: hypothetical protein L0Z53_21650 [Acidobacteriales bacterium]|nr:hypothetical protein [Terriglobales bacterium]